MYPVSLHGDCFIVATRDNLVKLQEKADPKPGCSRTGQLCTIQGTDLGIPNDSVEMANYHNEMKHSFNER